MNKTPIITNKVRELVFKKKLYKKEKTVITPPMMKNIFDGKSAICSPLFTA